MAKQLIRKRPSVNSAPKLNPSHRIYSQGFRQAVGATGSTPIPISLSSSGRKLLGITVVPITGTLVTLADVQISLSVNNSNLLNNVSAQNMNPNFVGGGMIYYPVNQPLEGNDVISVNVQNNAAAATLVVTVFYEPR